MGTMSHIMRSGQSAGLHWLPYRCPANVLVGTTFSQVRGHHVCFACSFVVEERGEGEKGGRGQKGGKGHGRVGSCLLGCPAVTASGSSLRH